MVKFLIADSSLQIRKWVLFNQVSSGFLKPFEVAFRWCVSSIQRASEDVTFFCIDGLGKNATCHDFGWPLDTAESCHLSIVLRFHLTLDLYLVSLRKLPLISHNSFLQQTFIEHPLWRVWTRHAKQGVRVQALELHHQGLSLNPITVVWL